MEILLWLAPAGVVTVLAMVWVSWAGRDVTGEVDRDVAAERLGRALAKELPATRRRTPLTPRDRSTGIAVRPSAGPRAGSEATRRTP